MQQTLGQIRFHRFQLGFANSMKAQYKGTEGQRPKATQKADRFVHLPRKAHLAQDIPCPRGIANGSFVPKVN